MFHVCVRVSELFVSIKRFVFFPSAASCAAAALTNDVGAMKYLRII